MDVLQHCVVGVDGSEGATSAFGWAVAQAAATKAGEVVAVHAFLPGAELFAAATQVNLDPVRAERQRLLDSDWTAAARGTTVAVRTELVDDEPAHALMSSAHRHSDISIVVGHHGHSRWSKHHIGHEASKLIHRSQSPVIVIGTSARPEPLHGTIIVGMHGPIGTSHPPVAWAASLAEDRNLSVHVVGVALPLAAGPGLGYSMAAYAHDMAQVEDLNNAAVSTLTEELRGEHPSLNVSSQAVLGHPSEVLATAVSELDAGLVVVGSHHSSALAGFMADGVVRHLAPSVGCPLAAVPVT